MYNFNFNSKKNPTDNRLFSSKGRAKYKFPMRGEVPDGQYVSRVVSAKFTQTKSGKKAIEVLYEIQDISVCKQIASGKPPVDTDIGTYYIRQIYPEGTSYYDTLIDSMAEALNVDEFELEDVVGVSEKIDLTYGDNDFGSFSHREPLKPEHLATLPDEEECFSEGYTEPESMDKPTFAQKRPSGLSGRRRHTHPRKSLLEDESDESDEFDEFDDFLDGIDED